jgi:protein-S-isoprenylcysteine O-methyltransferase Ste14
MVYSLFLGIIGFLSLLLYDFYQLNKRSMLTFFFSFIGYGCISLAIFFELYLFDSADVPLGLFIIKIGAAGISALLLIYSVFLEIPIKKKSMGGGDYTAIGKGMYGVIRHPGFLWFVLLQICIVWIQQNSEVLMLAIVFIGMDFFVIVIEDSVIFPRLFTNYPTYKERVPMVIPFLKSRYQQKD